MVTCAVCGTRVDDPPPAMWSAGIGPGGRDWLCENCVRARLRDIEARLEPPASSRSHRAV